MGRWWGGEEFSLRGALIQFVKPVEFLSPLDKKRRESGYLFRFGKALSSDVALRHILAQSSGEDTAGSDISLPPPLYLFPVPYYAK